MSKLRCEICGEEKQVPTCCDHSMILKNELLCCCSDDACHHRPIPECCGQKMNYITT